MLFFAVLLLGSDLNLLGFENLEIRENIRSLVLRTLSMLVEQIEAHLLRDSLEALASECFVNLQLKLRL